MKILTVEGQPIYVSKKMIDAIHKDDRISWAKNVLENHLDELPKKLEEFSEGELEDYAYALDDALLSNCGHIESQLILDIFKKGRMNHEKI